VLRQRDPARCPAGVGVGYRQHGSEPAGVLAHFGAERADCMELTTRVQIACQALWVPTHIARASGVAVMIGVFDREHKS